MDSSPELKGIMVWGVGHDHIDLNAASERGICVANTRGSNAESVAEHAIALVLALSRKVCQADAFVRGGGWTNREETGLPSELVTLDLSSKTLGIIGLGTIGGRVAQVAHALGMSVLAHDPFLTNEQAAERDVELVWLKTLLEKSDFVTIHVTLTSETRRMIGARELEIMKPTAYLINTSRGEVIDEKALIEALKTRIAEAGLDVFDHEPLGFENPLMKLNNVILTPHCAGSSKEALEATSWSVCEEAMRMLEGQIPKNILNRAELVKRGFMNLHLG
jgi:phosphoglycerate dehydrogenase-like enzyme